jgi:adenosylcobinamide kinase/adenosylcobinamide-phosphate guanylyltransferase
VLTLVLGGARSGKSRYARSLCGAGPVLFVATARPDGDPAWRARIDAHRRERPPSWETREEPVEVVGAVAGMDAGSVALVDCVTLWISNLCWEARARSSAEREAHVLERVEALAAAAVRRDVIAVSNEVGSGIVPEHPVAREFRDLHGRANQRLSAAAGRAVLLVAGLPLTLKGPS